ncbi:MAG: glycosyltransferase family 4 protein [Frankiaceae bacterium]|nr:glycosyltransferase family 4 protein [Frankiaceae bacterium]MBV9871819.1 glycosyltransferase family 4 protein [Frankiaceae bacterium]
MRVGLVSPYPWDVPGGVVAHIGDLAEALIARGHDVAVISPVDDDDLPLPSYLTRAGRSVPIPYNGSVSRLLIGPVSAARVRRWLHDGRFDVLHVHSPETFSLSLVALGNARGPIVATFHAANPKSRILSLLQNPLQIYLEKLAGSIAVSPSARKTVMDHLGANAVVVPNGVHIAKYAGASPLPGWPGEGGAIGFVGRVDEPRKGLAVLLDALPLIRRDHPAVRVLVAGPGDLEHVPDGVTVLGRVSDADKARLLASVDVFVAPNIGGESFGIVLLEAMAGGAPIVASDLDAFERVLKDGALGELAAVGDPASLAAKCSALLASPQRREELRTNARHAVARYDWSVVSGEVLRVYEMAIAARTGRVVEEPEPVDVPALPPL